MGKGRVRLKKKGGGETKRKRYSTRFPFTRRFNPKDRKEFAGRTTSVHLTRNMDRKGILPWRSMDSSSSPRCLLEINREGGREAALGMHNWPNRRRNRITINLEYNTAIKPMIDDWQR